MSARINLTGKRFGRLTVIKFTHVSRNKKACWDCICDCGSLTNVISIALINGNTRSCGCLLKEMQLLGLCNKKHGETIKKDVTPEYKIFYKMMDRCNNPNNKKDYKDYGGRGICVCSEWLHNFKAFLNDMGRRPSSKHSIDRIDNNKGYSKDNCKWSTQIEQANNKRNSRVLTYNSESFTVSQWARKLGIPRSSIDNRLRKNLSIDNVLTIRKYKSGSFKKHTA